MHASYKKAALIVVVLGIAIAFLLTYRNYVSAYFTKRSAIYKAFHALYEDELELNYQVLKTSFFLYENYDHITQIQSRIQKEAHTLARLFAQNGYEDLAAMFRKYRTCLDKKLATIEEFKTLNATIKNSSIYLASVLDRLPKNLSPQAKKAIIETISEIFVLKNSLDEAFTKEIKQNYQTVARYLDPNDPMQKLLGAHIRIFIEKFPRYKELLGHILASHSINELRSIEKRFESLMAREARTIDRIFVLLVLFYILATLLIIYFIIKLDKENAALRALQSKLRKNAITDDLTHLCNRRAFKKDVRRIKHPFFALVNINGFKHYNDFYGNRTGDHILRQTAILLQQIVPSRYGAKFYRVGGDDFGILIDETEPIDAKEFAQNIITAFENHKITFKSVDIYVSVSVGISRKRPLLETADMALKFVKQNSTLHYFVYDDKLGFFQQIRSNIKRSKILKKALDEGRIYPYFQPIVRNDTGTIAKYEVLARLKKEDGYFESIFPYLEIAKEIKLYRYITMQVVQKSFEQVYAYKKPISINISMKDIEDAQVLKFFGKMFEKYPGAARLVTFEILESETLSDYEAVKDFISIVRAQGCKVALDDFGSGYSNFAHVFNLDIDYIKIDGSLIQALPHDANARLIVGAIVRLAKEAGLETVAEFVADKAIFEEVKKLGIDYSQGYFFAAPSPQL